MALPEIKLFNTLSGKKEVFHSRHANAVNVYLCGPTVYGYTHVGNARASLVGDLVVRILRYAGYQVHFARNITDIDDKIIRVAQETHTSATDVAEKYAQAYREEQRQLHTLAPDFAPKATEHVSEIIDFSQELITNGNAYVSETPYGNDVYFHIPSFEGYGKLSKRKTDELLVGARIEPGENKRNPLDFALWKAAKPGEPSWKSPWGEGRPGWHIECSAMIRKTFPEGLDIHMGGLDLIFPHHENEIAQSESLSGKALAPYWVHGGMLTFAREKMSKSLGNVITTHQFLKDYGAETLRLLMFQSHYRSPLDFSDEVVLRTENLLERLYTAKKLALASNPSPSTPTEIPAEIAQLKEQFDAALWDDFGSAKALGLVLKGVRLCFKNPQNALWAAWGKILPDLDRALGLLHEDPEIALAAIRSRRLHRMGVTEEFCASIDARLQEREEARAQKDFATSDRMRAELEKDGILVMDGPDGAAWTLSPQARIPS